MLISSRFRWASLQLDALGKINEYGALQEALESLPPTLDETYQRILEEIQPNYRRRTLTLLQWLVFSARPLTVPELAEALALETEDEPRRYPSDQTLSLSQIQKYCSPLIEIGPSDTIRLAHFTVKEYLTSDRLDNEIQPHFTERVARAQIAKSCLGYLIQLDKDDIPQSLRENFPLASYASRYWMSHASAAEEWDVEVSGFCGELLLKPKAFKNAYRLYSLDRPWRNTHTTPILEEDTPTPLYYASLIGLSRTTSLLLKAGEDVNLLGGVYGTPLHAASRNGHAGVAEALIAAGADVNATNTTNFTPLQYAIMRQRMDTVKLLIRSGANTNRLANELSTKSSKTVARKKEDLRNETESHFTFTDASTFPESEIESMRSGQAEDAQEFHLRATASAVRRVQTLRHGLGTLSETNITSERTDYGTELGPGESSTDATSLYTSAGNGLAVLGSDEDDKTYYSGGSGVSNSKINEFIVEFADELLDKVRPENPDQRSRDRVKKVLPDLLKAFALKLGQNSEEKMHRDIILFTHKYRG